jgi:hypothetical protein
MLFLSMGMETGEESRKRRAKVESMEMNWDAGARVKLVTIAGGCKRGERGIEPHGPIATARAQRLCPKRRRSDSKYRVRLVKGRLRSDWVAAKKQRIVLTRMESYCNWDVVERRCHFPRGRRRHTMGTFGGGPSVWIGQRQHAQQPGQSANGSLRSPSSLSVSFTKW